MPLDSNTILEFIKTRADHPMKIRELAEALYIEDADYQRFRRTVKRLLDSGDLVRLKRGRIGLSSKLGVMVGAISINRSGTGFLVVEGNAQDILIRKWDLETALDGDKVMVRLKEGKHERPTGIVIRVVERSPRKIVGLFRKERHFLIVVPDNPRIHRDIYIPSSMSLEARDGERVVVELTAWEDPSRNPEGRVTERLGRPSDPGVDMLTIVRTYDLLDEFPPEVLEAAERESARSIDDEFSRRLDLTQSCVYTIDPADAKDHDDAVSVDRTAEGYRLGVHIADVSYYVEAGSPLDKEAFVRGNSVYLPGMVIPMLPELLSNDACSLRPDRPRLAHSVFMDFDKTGKLLKWEVADTVIQSCAKLAYEEVQQFFDGDKVAAIDQRLAENLRLARELAALLTRQRFAEGSLDFDLPEAKIVLGERGEVLELGHRVRLEAHRLVEEFMLAANRAVALEVFRKAQPFIYRVHAHPDLEKLEAFSAMMTRLGHHFPVSKKLAPKHFAKFLRKVKDTPEEDMINELMLRSMQKAVYQRDNIGHFGLAFSHYTHFTSPIRRYPDLLVHRLLRSLSGNRYPVALARRVAGIIDHVSSHCSDTERKAEAAERQAIKAKQVTYMAKHLGDEFGGVVSGVTAYGFFVRLDDMGVEGMVRFSTIDDDYYQFDEANYRIVGRRLRRSYRLGDAVKVGIMKVDTDRHEIDLFMADKKHSKKKAAARPSAKPPGTRGRIPKKKINRKKKR